MQLQVKLEKKKKKKKNVFRRKEKKTRYCLKYLEAWN